MIRVFLDSSTLFAAAYSSTGGARALLHRAIDGRLLLFVSKLVEDETFRNICSKAPVFEPVLRSIIDKTPLHRVLIVEEGAIVRLLGHVEPKDAHVVAAAMLAECEYIITHDKAHLIGNPAIEIISGIRCISPGDLLAIQKQEDDAAGAGLA